MASILPPPPTDNNPSSPSFRDWFYKLQQVLQNFVLVIINAIGALGTGFVVKTSSTTFAARTIEGTDGQIDITNGDGVAGNPVISVSPDIYAFAAAQG